MMRTNIVIDDSLMKEAMKASGLKTKRAVVEAGLRLVVELRDQARALRELKGIGWDGALDEMRGKRRR
jgi:Arc/MetJ family transcription regulator